MTGDGRNVVLSKSRTAVLRIRLIPWRPRQRRIDPIRTPDGAESLLDFGDDLVSFALGVGLWLAIVVAPPLVVIILAIVLLPIEIGLVAIIGLAFLVARFAGVMRWTVVIVEPDGRESVEYYRNIVRALRRAREINASRGRVIELVWS